MTTSPSATAASWSWSWTSPDFSGVGALSNQDGVRARSASPPAWGPVRSVVTAKTSGTGSPAKAAATGAAGGPTVRRSPAASAATRSVQSPVGMETGTARPLANTRSALSSVRTVSPVDPAPVARIVVRSRRARAVRIAVHGTVTSTVAGR